jgi:hypothetical protein
MGRLELARSLFRPARVEGEVEGIRGKADVRILMSDSGGQRDVLSSSASGLGLATRRQSSLFLR